MSKPKLVLHLNDDEIQMRLDRFLRSRFPHLQQSLIEKMLRKGDIKVCDAKAKSSHRLQQNDTVTYPDFLENLAPLQEEKALISPLTREETRQISEMIIWEDDWIIALNKPSGLATQGGARVGRSVDVLLSLFYPEHSPRLVHRLDKDTSGVLLLAKTRKMAQQLTDAFRLRQIQKVYHAVIVGVPDSPEGMINLPLTKTMVGKAEKVRVNRETGLPARTQYSVVRAIDLRVSLIELRPETGRTHQLRVHCADGLGTPILGDGKYGGKDAFPKGRTGLCLHASEIAFTHPETGRFVKIDAPFPERFEDILSGRWPQEED